MRIALIHLGRRGSGGPISLELASHLSRQAQVLAVLSARAENLPAWQRAGVEHFSVPTYQSLPGAVWSWLEGRRIARLAERIRAWKPDVLLFPMFYTWNPFLQRRLGDIPAVVAVHDPRPHPGLSGSLFGRLEDRSIRQAARCLLFSRVFLPDLVRKGVPPDRIDVIPHGDLSYYKNLTPDHPSGPGEAAPAAGRAGFEDAPLSPAENDLPTLLFFGRITAYKGLDVLLEAYARVRQHHPARLHIAGGGDIRPFRRRIEALPDATLDNRWIPDDEVAGIFRRAAIVALPYTSATQSGVLPLAASFGLPVIATHTGGLPEQIEDGRTGLLVAPNSVEPLAAAIERLLVEPDLGRRLGEALRAEFQQRRSWEGIAGLVLAACQRAAGAVQIPAVETR